jgi:Tol biopolymer transport system component
MQRFLFLGLFLLTACTFVSEPLAVTRIPAATAVPPSPTTATLAPVTAIPTPTPTAATAVESATDSSAAEDNVAIYVINADGTGLKQLTDPADNKFLYNWSPDGQQIAFMWASQSVADIYVMAKDGSQVRQLTDWQAITTLPTWSPDGRFLAVSSRSVDDYLDQGLYVMQADGSQVRRLTEGLQVESHQVQWSPDGRFLLFTASRDETYNERRTDIYVVAADGSGLQTLTQSAGEESTPLWSPDGQRIAFRYSEEVDQWRVQVMNRDGSGLVELTQLPGWGGLAGWSPDGRSLLFANNFVPGQHPDAFDIYTLDIESGAIYNLTDNPFSDYYPMWSPDGQQITFTSDRDGNEEIYVMAADGSNLTRLTFDNGRDWPAIWSPDGHQIAFNRTPSLVFEDDVIEIVITATSVPAATATATSMPSLTAVYPQISLTQTIPFTQTVHGYTLQYPDGLHSLSNFGIESNSYFATQPDIGSPMEMNLTDFWITIRPEENPDGLSLEQWAEARIRPGEEQTLTVAGIPALQFSGDLGAAGDSHSGFGIITYFAHNGQIFTVTGLALTADALTYYTPVYQFLLDSFRFFT